MSQLDKYFFRDQMRRLDRTFPRARKWEIKELRKAYYDALKFSDPEHLEQAVSKILADSADKKPWYWPTVQEIRALMPRKVEELTEPRPAVHIPHKLTGYNPTEKDRLWLNDHLIAMGFKK